MNKSTPQSELHSLKWFLIQRFLVTMVFIFVSEELLNMVNRIYIAPFLTDTLNIELHSVVSGEDSMMVLMFSMLLFSAASLLPENIARWIQAAGDRSIKTGIEFGITSPLLEGVTSPVLVELYKFAVILIFMALLLATLLPYIISAYWYYKAVSGKVSALLLAQKEQKEEYDRQRNLLLSDIAHDIKTPITTVCGYARALADGVVSKEEKKKEYLQAIYNKSIRVDELINLLFEYVKLDSIGFELHMEMADLGELLRENIALHYSDFEEKGIEPEVDIPEDEVPYKMDKIQMGRVVTNILTNIVKHSGSNIKVRISLVRMGGMAYQISIADSGEPIDEYLAEHIFEPFSRGDRSRNTKGGSGLGLGIAHKIVHMHGGELALDINCGNGYTKAFIISLS